jgi:hypothetical protein
MAALIRKLRVQNSHPHRPGGKELSDGRLLHARRRDDLARRPADPRRTAVAGQRRQIRALPRDGFLRRRSSDHSDFWLSTRFAPTLPERCLRTASQLSGCHRRFSPSAQHVWRCRCLFAPPPESQVEQSSVQNSARQRPSSDKRRGGVSARLPKLIDRGTGHMGAIMGGLFGLLFGFLSVGVWIGLALLATAIGLGLLFTSIPMDRLLPQSCVQHS